MSDTNPVYSILRFGPLGLLEQSDGETRTILFRGPYKETKQLLDKLNSGRIQAESLRQLPIKE